MSLDILESTKTPCFDMLPEKSRKQYLTAYTSFMEWRSKNNINSLSEDVLLDYFTTLSKTYKSSSLWTLYSMLRSTLNANDNISLETYTKLRSFLKCKSEGYHAKKSKTFTPEEINTFINEAPDIPYLPTKVALIMGIIGACRANEMYAMNVEDVQDLGLALLVTIPNTKSKVVRKFTITNNYYQICKKYTDLRPSSVPVSSFFLNYHSGKCTNQKIGYNKFGTMGKQIAKFLKLPEPDAYTGHSFRRSSATLGVDAGGDLTALRRHGGWRETAQVEGNANDSMTQRSNATLLQPPEQSHRQSISNIYVKDESISFSNDGSN